MNRFEFMCEMWSYNKAIKGEIDAEIVDRLMDDWKHSMKSFRVWKKEFKRNKIKS